MGFIVDEALKKEKKERDKELREDEKENKRLDKIAKKHEHNPPEYLEDVRKTHPKHDSLDLREGLMWKCSCGKLFQWKVLDTSFLTYSEMKEYIDLHFKINKMLGTWKPVSVILHPLLYMRYGKDY